MQAAKSLSGYTITKTLGKGLYGEVKLATGPDGQEYAIKKFRGVFSEGIETPSEVALTLQASHPNIIRAKEYFFKDGVQYLVMELAQSNLEEYVQENDLTQEDRVRLLYELVSALVYLQENGFYHCDIKPINILIKDNHVKLGDLGISAYKSVRSSVCNSFFSPQDYYKNNLLAFEDGGEIPGTFIDVFQETVNYQTSDMWALGVTLAFILTDKLLFYTEDALLAMYEYLDNPREYLQTNLPGLSTSWLDLLENMLQPKQEDRIHLAREVLQYPEFVKRSFSKPIPGLAPIFYNLDIAVTPDRRIRVLVDWLEEVRDEYKLNSFTLASTVACLYYVFDDLTDKGRNVKILQCLGCACLLLMANVYDAHPPLPEDLVYISADIFTEELLLDMERKVMDKLSGRLYFNTLATLAFSRDAYEKSKEVLFDASLYSNTNLAEYMKELELTETIQERNTRQDV
ncbi:CAMK family protein kinase [Cedratvirus A11]|uniref:CAMK family protein kinase n=1 Tax=Cedratvirus A11 TaxID=1903266 RepID=A0A1M7XV92_9VIRU|nr:CAMK family protein kinase [Cedratvirus A11]SHO33577.1 CAMK family protein kinase [Cedratvirus A11]